MKDSKERGPHLRKDRAVAPIDETAERVRDLASSASRGDVAIEPLDPVVAFMRRMRGRLKHLPRLEC